MLKVKIDELKRMMFECFNTYNKKVVEIKVANIDKKREVTDILLSFTIGENTLTRYIYVFKVDLELYWLCNVSCYIQHKDEIIPKPVNTFSHYEVTMIYEPMTELLNDLDKRINDFLKEIK